MTSRWSNCSPPSSSFSPASRPGHRRSCLVQRDPTPQADWYPACTGCDARSTSCAISWLENGLITSAGLAARPGRRRGPELVPGHAVRSWPCAAVVPASRHACSVAAGSTCGAAAGAACRQYSARAGDAKRLKRDWRGVTEAPCTAPHCPARFAAKGSYRTVPVNRSGK